MSSTLRDETVKKVIEIYRNSDPRDEDFCEKMDTAVKMYDAVNDEDENDISDEKNQIEKESRFKDRLVRIGEIGATVILTTVSVILTQMRFNKATAKEFDEPIIGIANRTEVQEDLREGRHFKLFGK